MPEEQHAEDSAEDAEHSGKDQVGFRDAPFVVDGFPFVDAIQEKYDQVDQDIYT